jgi:hypothetical protein
MSQSPTAITIWAAAGQQRVWPLELPIVRIRITSHAAHPADWNRRRDDVGSIRVEQTGRDIRL